MGTALKILFSGDTVGLDSTVTTNMKKPFQLVRTEIVALFNAFGRYVKWLICSDGIWIPKSKTLYYAEHFTLHRFGIRLLLPISVQDSNLSPSSNIFITLRIRLRHTETEATPKAISLMAQ